MALQTFTWCPRSNTDGSYSFDTLSAQFGDGFIQDVGQGINNESQSWPLVFNGYENEILPIRNFLRSHKGYQRFLWTPPAGVEGFYICKSFKLQALAGSAYVLTATFEQRFAP